jgi:hypothetical protein
LLGGGTGPFKLNILFNEYGSLLLARPPSRGGAIRVFHLNVASCRAHRGHLVAGVDVLPDGSDPLMPTHYG